MKKAFKNKSILITGGTGSFGKAFVKYLLVKKVPFKKIIIFSRDELKQYEMKKNKDYSPIKYKNLRYFIGDVRDKSRLSISLKDVDYVIHAAALKQVDTAEYNPTEYIDTNIIGAKNLIEVAADTNLKKIVSLSTDKASSPINLYGATKLCSDKLFIAANNYVPKCKFSIVRYGNVVSTRGSVIPLFKSLKKGESFPVTSKDMTRFSLNMEEAINIVLWTLEHSIGKEIVVPKIPSYRLLDLVKSINEKPKIKIIGIRPGEKLHEELISSNDSVNTFETKKYYLILPMRNVETIIYYKKKFGIKQVRKNFSYSSDKNPDFLKIKDLKKIIFS